MSRRKTTEQFIADSVAVHGDKYSYEKVVYVNTNSKVLITCPEHGDFWQTSYKHIAGQGCPKCGKAGSYITRSRLVLIKKFEGLVQPEDHKLIPLTRGKFAKVDNEDFDRVKDINWNYSQGYALNTTLGSMHRFIMNAPEGVLIDHKENSQTLDNRKGNLRFVDRSKNSMNSKPRKGCTSEYKGVYWVNSRKKWAVAVTINRKAHFLGYFTNEEEAGQAYDTKALELFGEFAHLNFPKEENIN